MKRRDFLKSAYYASLGAIVIRYLKSDEVNASQQFGQATLPNQNLAGKQLYEGQLKVTGGKIYAIDFRAKDLPGWPVTERRHLVLRANQTERIYLGLRSDELRRDLGIFGLVTGDDVYRWGCRGAAPFLAPQLYMRTGQPPSYLGQPILQITFPSTDHFLAVKSSLADLSQYLLYGETASPRPSSQSYGASRFVYYQGSKREPEFSYMKNVDPSMHANTRDPLDARHTREMEFINKIERDLDQSNWKQFHKTFRTQSVDPVFMEPENGLSWFESKSGTLTLTIGTQSPHEDAVAILEFFSKATTPRIKKVVINCCFLGGGFGGKDSSDFPIHLAIAAVNEPDVSHRIVHSRSDQFQAGLKRHPSETNIQLAVDGTGKFQMLHSDIRLDGGGQNNYSFAVQSVGARNAGGGYHFPRAWVDAVAFASPSIPSGSMRGFGSFQTSFALECLIDEAAQALKMDPIELRIKNSIEGKGLTISGVRLALPTHAHQVLHAARSSRTWQDRETKKKNQSKESTLVGTGFAMGFKTYGKNENGCLAGVEITEQGELLLYTSGVDMGNGSATTLSVSLASVLGRSADQVNIGVTEHFDALNIFSTPATSEEDQKKLSANPFWTPSIVISSAASTSAYHLRHAVFEAAKIVLEFGIWPAAVRLLNLPKHRQAFNSSEFVLKSDGFHYQDGRILGFAALTQAAHAHNDVTGALIHAYYRETWAEASFNISGTLYRSKIDAISVRQGRNPYQAIARKEVQYPSLHSLEGDANRMASYAVIVSVAVNQASGEVRVVDAETFLDCGPVIQREIVEGQMQGAFAMGIGQTLTESLTDSSDSAGNGGWNLNRYQLPLMADCAVGVARFNIVLPVEGDEPRGISEVVFNPVPAAIVNAIADATGVRLTQLPIKPIDLKAALS